MPEVQVGAVVNADSELDALPVGAVVRDSVGCTWERMVDGWDGVRVVGEKRHGPWLPARILDGPDDPATQQAAER